MFSSRLLLLACVGVGVALLSGCPVVPPDVETRIEYFIADSTLVRRGAEVSFQWDARNAAVYEGSPSCSISRRFEGGEAQQADLVPCQGELTEVPAAPLSASYVNYQLNVLRRPYDGSDPEPYLTQVIQVGLQDLEEDDPQTSIEFFSVDATTIVRGDPILLSWSVRNPGVDASVPSCSLSWQYEGGDPSGPSEVACTGLLQEVPDPPGESTAYVRYQLNALKSSADADDPYLTAVVTVTLLEAPAPEPVVVGVNPASVTLSVGASQSFTASVTGAADPSVTWGASCGSFSSTGNPATYVAPASAGTCSVTATSVADGSASASASVAVLEMGAVRWTRQFGTSATDVGSGVAVDGVGNVLVAGYTSGSLAGANAGGSDAFVRKLDSAGTELWTRLFGTVGADVAWAVAVDSMGNVLVAGYTSGSLAGANAGGSDAFVRKLDAEGNESWTHQFGSSGSEHALGLAADRLGNVLVAGYTAGSLTGASAGGLDAFVRKLDSAGNEVWTHQFGTSATDVLSGVAVDALGNVLVAGRTFGSLAGANAGEFDAFVRKLDGAGNELWTRQFGGVSSESIGDVAVDGAGNVLVTGYTAGSLAGANAGADDVFVWKLDAGGDDLWTRQIGSSSSDYGQGVAVDGSGNVLIAGYSFGSLASTNIGSSDMFVWKLDDAGNDVWVQQSGTVNADQVGGVSVDASGNVLVAGWTDGALDGENSGFQDVFVQKRLP